MRPLKEHNIVISTALAFALIPLSGFATDVYLPSFPAMAAIFGTSQADIQLSLAVFVVSNGIGQLFVGGLLDSFGRYRLSLAALVVFAISCVVIAMSHSVTVLLAMRIVQGVAVALIVVSKRAFFIDTYSGSQLKHYTSLFSIMWATAPIIAPFAGGFLQHYLGWESNFYFLASVTLIILLLELVYSGETLKAPQPFKPKQLLSAYTSKLKTPDFVVSLVILGASFSIVIVYNMTSPFIIQHTFHQSAVTIGNCSLLSGLAIMAGGLLSKRFINRSLSSKMMIAGPSFFLLSNLMVIVMHYDPSFIAMMTLIILLHVAGGFTFNSFYTFALGRFSSNAGILSGIVGGGTYILTSIFSYTVVSTLQVRDPLSLSLAYLSFAVLIGSTFIVFAFLQKQRFSAESHTVPAS
jgi:MFS transporter, DHA1 family, multidrug resistance protein